MTPNLASTSGVSANITSELVLGADYTFDQDRTIDVHFRLSSLTGTAANFTYLLRLKSSGGAKIAEFPPSPSAITKRATSDTVFGDQIRRVFGKAGEKLELRVLSSNVGDTAVAWERDIIDADFATGVSGQAAPANWSTTFNPFYGTGTIQAGATTTTIPTNIGAPPNPCGPVLIGSWLYLTSGLMAGGAVQITGSTSGANATFTVFPALPVAPINGTTFTLVSAPAIGSIVIQPQTLALIIVEQP